MKPEDEAAKDVLNRRRDALPEAAGTTAAAATDERMTPPPSTDGDSGAVFTGDLEDDS